ncbi:MAG: hypothetical protein M1458_02720 [Deltaproteobacteria bacterium]|nr:hypothetical protein [Deltaproteobacteria bacterium]
MSTLLSAGRIVSISNSKLLRLFCLSTFLVTLAALILVPFMSLNAPKAYASGMFDTSVTGGAYFQNLSGHLAVGNSVNGFIPTNITPSDIGLQTTKTAPVFKVAFLILYSNSVSFTYVPYVYGGSKVLSESIIFNGQTYNISTPVTSKLDLYSYKLFYTHDFSINRFAEIGIGAGVNVMTAKAELDSPVLSESKNVNLPLPVIGGKLKISPLNNISFIGKFQGFTIGSKGYYYHIKAGVNYEAVGPLSVFADYVYDKIHVDTNGVDGSLAFDGPEAGLRLGF